MYRKFVTSGDETPTTPLISADKILDQLEVAVFALDETHVVTYANAAATTLVAGVFPNGRSVRFEEYFLDHASDIAELLVLNEGETKKIDVVMRSNAMAGVDVEVVAHGVDGGYVASVQRLTYDRIRAQALTTATGLLQASEEMVIITDPQGSVEWVNTAFEARTGWELAEISGKNPATFLNGPRTDPVMAQSIADAVNHGRYFTGELWRYTKTGEEFRVSLRFQPVFGRHGRVEHFISLSVDTTGRGDDDQALVQLSSALDERVLVRTTELERELQVAHARAEAKSSFASTMSHEIRTPLNAIVGFSHLLQETSLSDTQRSYVSKTQRAASMLMDLVNNVLDISKIEAGAMTLTPVPFNFRSVFSDVEAVAGTQARSKGLNFSLTVDPEIPDVVRGDQNRFTEVLLNLVGNAVKFTSEGSVEVLASRVKSPDQSVVVRCDVVDTGIGMSRESITRIFQRFVQIDSGMSRNYGGTGLGLTISKVFVEMMGGSMTVESELGQGSRFSFTVQFSQPSANDSTEIMAAPTEKTYERLARSCVLVVEDNPFNQDVIVNLLERRGVDVVVAANGVQAIDALSTHRKIMLILMDLQMPVMDGIEATMAIRRETKWDRIVILGLTANVTEKDHRQCLEAGMSEVLAKPLAPELLYQTLEQWLPSPREQVEQSVLEGSQVDRSVLPELLGGDAAKVSRFANKFVQVMNEAMTEIVAAAEVMDFSRIGRQAHTLKSSSLTVGARYFGERCAELDVAAGNFEREKVETLVSELSLLAVGVASELEQLAVGNSS